MLECCDTFIEPAFYKKFDRTLSAYLQYRLVVTPDPYNKTEYNDIFSLLVIKLQSDHQSEVEFIYDISRTREKAFRLLSMLAENSVTPTAVQDIVEDFI